MVLRTREQDLAEATEEAARLSARHQSADRRISDAQKARARHATEADTAARQAEEAELRLAAVARDVASADEALAAARDLAARAEETLT